MFAKVNTAGLLGIDGFLTEVEADVQNGLPGFYLTGALSPETREAQFRVWNALRNSGISPDPRKITVNFSPASVRKDGTAYDLPIAVAVLCAMEILDHTRLRDTAFFGEVGLDGSIKKVRGALPLAFTLRKNNIRRLVVPPGNVMEASLAEDIIVCGCASIREVIDLIRNDFCAPGTVSASGSKPVPGHGTAPEHGSSAIPDSGSGTSIHTCPGTAIPSDTTNDGWHRILPDGGFEPCAPPYANTHFPVHFTSARTDTPEKGMSTPCPYNTKPAYDDSGSGYGSPGPTYDTSGSGHGSTDPASDDNAPGYGSPGPTYDTSGSGHGNPNRYDVDFSEVHGQEYLKRAAEIAVSGRHNLLMSGPAGTGKTMIARRMPTIMPDLTREEDIEISKVYSICGLLPEDSPLLSKRPFRSPHHGISDAALAGGGALVMPGEISLASGGILFLDEMPLFSRTALEMLRQPMEEGRITVTRVKGSYVYPADFMLVAAMNNCACGFYPDKRKCTCSRAQIKAYMGRLSRPLMERIDICAEARPVGFQELSDTSPGESSAAIRKRVEQVYAIQAERFRDSGRISFNSRMKIKEIEKFCKLGPTEQDFIRDTFRTRSLSGRTYHKILKVARTIADMDGSDNITVEHLIEAVGLRSIEDELFKKHNPEQQYYPH